MSFKTGIAAVGTAVVATGLLATAALADGMPAAKKVYAQSAPVEHAASYDRPAIAMWSGLYGGSSIGFGWAGADYTTGFGATAAGPFTLADDFSHSMSDWVGGGQIGLQHQWQHLVAGIEVAVTGSLMKDTQDTPKFPGYIHEANLRYLDTVTGKLGYAWDKWMVYGKAGYAGAAINMNYNKDRNPGFVTAANRVDARGWTIGIGAEYMWMPGVSTGLEYDYYRLDADKSPFLLTNGTWQSQSGINVDAHTILLRTNFHLHRAEQPAEAMK